MKPSSRPPSREAAAIEQAAADWIARCDRGLTPDEAAEFARWENADPRHPAELARLSATWQALNTADEIPEIMRFAREIEEQPRHRRLLRRYWPALATLGAAATVVVVAWWGLRGQSAGPASGTGFANASYKVVPSTAQRLPLADGTVVELNGDSAVEPSFTTSRRLVRLVRGEAHFHVAKDPARPFVVQAGNVAVQAVGTVFNVRYDPAAVEVLVTEGRVRVDDATDGRSLLSVEAGPAARDGGSPAADFPVLTAGERVVIPVNVSTLIAPMAVTADELDRALGWQATQLVFDRTSLAEAVAAFNSFNRRQLVLGDPVLAARQLGGTFRADNVDAFIRLLETGFDIRAESHDSQTILRSAR